MGMSVAMKKPRGRDREGLYQNGADKRLESLATAWLSFLGLPGRGGEAGLGLFTVLRIVRQPAAPRQRRRQILGREHLLVVWNALGGLVSQLLVAGELIRRGDVRLGGLLLLLLRNLP